jgi:DNA repair exonuclease SbcCD nuclease subunit
MSNKVKVIAIGDQHFQVSNIPEVDLFIEKITELVARFKPDFIVLLGDLLHEHERINTVPLNRAYTLIDNLRKISRLYVLVGNHDMQNNSVFLTDSHWLNALKEWENVIVVDAVIEEVINDVKFIFSPYVFAGRFYEALNTIGDNWKDASCIFAHQEFFGCKMGAFNSIDGDKWETTYPNVISGHIHLNQRPQKNIYYPGSSLQVAFGETSKNIIACVMFTSENNEYELEEVELDLPKKHIIYTDIEDIEKVKIPEHTDENKLQDKVKVSISGVYEDFKSFKKTKKYKDLVSKGVKVIFKPKRSEIKNGKENIKSALDKNPNDFNEIIHIIIQDQKNPYLLEAYELVLNSKEINPDDVLYLD